MLPTMALSKVLQKCTLGRFEDATECSNIFRTAKDLGTADTMVQINPGPGPRDTFQFHRILLGLNRANPLLLLTSEECGKFSVCSNHVDKLCKDPIKINAGKQKCRSCMKLMGERLASLKNSISLTIAKRSPVVMGEMICSQCRKVPLENEAELIAFLQKEHRLATANNEADDIIGVDDAAPEGGDGGFMGAVGGGLADDDIDTENILLNF